MPALNRRRSHHSSTNPGPSSAKLLPSAKKQETNYIENPGLVRELLAEISYLKGQLTTYKHAFLLVKEKYL